MCSDSLTLPVYVEAVDPDDRPPLPRQGKPGDAGRDVYATQSFWLLPFFPRVCPLGFRMQLPDLVHALVWDRSGLAARGITTLGGLLDNPYRGEVAVVLANLTLVPRRIRKGDRIAQLLMIESVDTVARWAAEPLTATERGAAGFASTGR